ncbi:uncharacterized protein LODBEIA_P21820 [Lodderomyces beijingensis]|uniref:Uncharacterized protein n=1 Tax=Lodderomyces beijingensis TaxID=1775926 RepID=A0ABP0ZIJ7_9ASCO
MSSTESHDDKSITSTHHHENISRVQITGEGQEFVIINNRKYYRHDLMKAFGGYLNPGVSPYPEININPAPLGLCAFALTNLVICLYNARAMGITIPNAIAGLGCFYGGGIQMLAGFGEFWTGNTFAFTALTSYGAYWISYAVLFLDSFGIKQAYEGTGQWEQAQALFMLPWVIITFLLWLNTLKSTVAFSGLFFFLLMTYILFTAGLMTGNFGCTRAGSVMGVITSTFAWWNAFAGVATPYNSYFLLPSIPMPDNTFLKLKWFKS